MSAPTTTMKVVNLMQETPIVSTIFNENATATELLQLVGCIAIFWTLFFYFFCMAVRPFVRGRAWIQAAGARDYENGGKEMYEALGVPIDKEEFLIRFEDQWPWMQAVMSQHMIGGLLCIPAILSIGGNRELQVSLAALSVLSEMGWEVSDMAGWIYTRYFTKGGKIKVPLGIVILMAVHHSLTTTLGLPMIIHYRDNPNLHWLTFDLQCAGAVGLIVTEYTKLLDVSNPKELRQFQYLSGFALVMIIITRGFHWVYLCAQLIMTWYEEKAWTFLIVGSICSTVFSAFNYFFCIAPFYQRFVKFLKISHDYKSLPASADKRTRRASLVNLQGAASNVMVNTEDWKAELADLIERRNIRTANKSNRRDTMPASMFSDNTGSSGGSRRRRASKLLYSSLSLGNFSVALNQLHIAGDVSEEDLKEQ